MENEVTTIEVTCEGPMVDAPNCGHTWKAKFADIRTEQISFLGAVFDIYCTTCPNCGVTAGISSWKIPKELKDRL